MDRWKAHQFHLLEHATDSPYFYHLQNQTKAHKQMEAKISINCHGEMNLKQFTKDEKDLSLYDPINKFDEHQKISSYRVLSS